MKKRVRDSNVSLNPNVVITRDLRMDKYLMKKPSKLIKRRKTTVQRPNIASPIIPIGARGRRHSTPIFFVGLAPNMDGIVLKKSTFAEPRQNYDRNICRNVRPPTPPRRQSTSTNQACDVDQASAGPSNARKVYRGVRPPTPPRRQSTSTNQARDADQTSVPSTPERRQLTPISELAPTNVLSESNTETTIDVDVEDSFIGRLYYTASDSE